MYDILVSGVESWNDAFSAAGYPEPVVHCIAPGDKRFPKEYQCGDARFNSIFMGEPPGLFGYGPSLVDFRSGEILVANILLGFSAFVSAASRYASLTRTLSEALCGTQGV